MEQLVLLLIIAGISLINWLVEKSKKLREQKQFEKSQSESSKAPAESPEPAPVPRSMQEEDSSDQMRRLLEAMEMPTGFPDEPATEEPEPLQARLPEPPPLPKAPPPAPSRPTLRKKRQAAVASTEHATLWSNRLRSRSALREAIVLREILGPPRALSQP